MPENVNTSALFFESDEEAALIDNRSTMIKVDHVSMVFNMASEQLNSLKEYAIQIARRKLFFEGFTALDDISFEVKKGDVFGIIGTNGSGKSTILKIIAGVLEPTKGSCEINGNIAPLIELGAGFDTELSARENIYLNGALLGYSKQFIDEHFDEIVDFAEIEKFLDMPLKNYSSGMVARIAFAIATVIVPEILVIDEVLSVGDFMFQKKCEDRINELIEKHSVTVLIVSHSNDQIARLCNKAIWIEKGHTRMMGDAETVCRVYGGLGGRTGSVESEQRVFNALCGIDPDNSDNCNYSIISGDNCYGTATRAAILSTGANPVDTVVLTCSNVHINAIIASGIASHYHAPILPIKTDCIPDIVEQFVMNKKPTRIVLVDRDGIDEEVLNQLQTLAWHPEVIAFANPNDTLGLSADLCDYGSKQNIWHDTAIVLKFQDNIESFAAAPLASRGGMPIFFLAECSQEQFFSLSRTLEKYHFKNVIAIGSIAESELCTELESKDMKVIKIAGSSTSETCLKVTLAAYHEAAKHNELPIELCLSSQTLGQWPELLACGSYCALVDGILLLEDITDLDSIAACLDFVNSNKGSFNRLSFLGGDAVLNELDRLLLYKEWEHSSIAKSSRKNPE